MLRNLYSFDFSLAGDRVNVPKREQVSFNVISNGPYIPPTRTYHCQHPKCGRRHRHKEGVAQKEYTFFAESFVSLQAQGGATFAENLLEFHRRMGHPNFNYCRNLLKLPASKDNPICPECEVAKARQRPLPTTRVQRSTRVIHRIHMDLGFSKDGQTFQLYIDDFSRFAWVDFLRSKDQNLEAFVRRQRQWENHHAPWKVAAIKTDSEAVYTSKRWQQHCEDNGIVHDCSAPYKHGQNGVVERRMGTIGSSARAQMLYGNAPAREFKYAIMHTAAATNDWPTKANNGISPRSKFLGVHTPPARRLLQAPLFCLVYLMVYEQQRSKYGDRGRPALYLGLDGRPGVFLAREWPNGRVVYCADGKFLTNQFPCRQEVPRLMHDVEGARQIQHHNNAAPQPLELKNDNAPQVDLNPIPSQDFKNNERDSDFPVARNDHSELLDEKHTDDGLRRSTRNKEPTTKALENIASYSLIDTIKETIKIDQGLDDGIDPQNRKEALASNEAQYWLLAEEEEAASHRHHNTTKLVKREQWMKVYKQRPVYKKKRDEHGLIDRYKARFTVAAYAKTMKQGIDYKEKYAATAHWSTYMLLLTFAATKDIQLNFI